MIRWPEESKDCEHQWEMTLAQSGMYFIEVCKKCRAERPFIQLDVPDSVKNKISDCMIEMIVYGNCKLEMTVEEFKQIKINTREPTEHE